MDDDIQTPDGFLLDPLNGKDIMHLVMLSNSGFLTMLSNFHLFLYAYSFSDEGVRFFA